MPEAEETDAADVSGAPAASEASEAAAASDASGPSLASGPSVSGSSADADAADRSAGPLRLPLSPVGANRMRPATIATVLVSAAALGVAGSSGSGALLVTTLVLSLVLAWCWPVVGGSFTPDATAVVLLLSAVAIVLSALRDDLRWTAAAVALGIVLSFFSQLIRRTGREGLVLTLLAAFGGLVPMASAATAISHADDPAGRAFLVVAMASAASAVVADLLVRQRALAPFLGLIALLAAIAGAVVVGIVIDEFGPWAALGVGAAAGSLSFSFRRVFSLQPAMLTARGQVAAGVASVLLTGAVVHLFALL